MRITTSQLKRLCIWKFSMDEITRMNEGISTYIPRPSVWYTQQGSGNETKNTCQGSAYFHNIQILDRVKMASVKMLNRK